MTAHDHFDDNELATFFKIEEHKEFDQLRIENEHTVVADRVWTAIETLNMDLAVSRDPSVHQDDFNALEKEIAQIIDTLPENHDPEYSKSEHIHAIANSLWDEQTMRIEQISIALDTQLYGNISAAEKAFLKKKVMARIMVHGDGQEPWLSLADTVLDGDALDLNNPDDYEFITEALEITANLENAPEVKLFDSILTLLGVPNLSEDIPENYDMDHVELLTFAARDITEAAIVKVQADQQPERYSSIHEIVRSYGLQDDVDVQSIFKLADSYAEQKIAQS